jgi:CRP-like cAMP-binding protein
LRRASIDLLSADAEDDRALFIVLSGRLEAYRSGGEGERTIIEMLPGDLIGEMAFIDGRPRSASVRALERSSVLRIRPQDVDALCRTNPALGVKFMREIACILSDRVRRTMAAL